MREHPQPRVQSEKAHEQSHHGCAGGIRRSARNGFKGLLRERDPRRPIHASCRRSWRKAMRRDLAVWASPHTLLPSAGPNKKAPLLCEECARSSSPRVEHRTRPPHPTPRIVTIAKRPSKWDGMDRNIIHKIERVNILRCALQKTESSSICETIGDVSTSKRPHEVDLSGAERCARKRVSCNAQG